MGEIYFIEPMATGQTSIPLNIFVTQKWLGWNWQSFCPEGKFQLHGIIVARCLRIQPKNFSDHTLVHGLSKQTRQAQ